jgi:tyrosine-specific transport protein
MGCFIKSSFVIVICFIKFIKKMKSVSSFSHVIGGALIVAGTSIGAGMLALPVVTSITGFYPSIFVYLICWLVMTSTGLLYLEVAVRIPADANIISMASIFLGKKWKAVTWILYLFLFYCLSVSYISGGGEIILNVLGLNIPQWLMTSIFVLFFGSVVYLGTNMVDRINFLLMVGLCVTFLFFVVMGIKQVNVSLLNYAKPSKAIWSLPVVLLSFGYQGVVPSLTYYLKKNIKQTRLAIIVGTTFVLLVYLLWEFLILGVVPIEGKYGLANAKTAVAPLRYYLNVNTVHMIGDFFGFFAITTSFLGISLGLFDFFSDGLKLKKKGKNKLFIFAFTFLPPLLVTLIYPDVFIEALQYAAVYGGIVLLIFLPTLLAWRERYVVKSISHKKILPGGKSVLIFLFCFSVLEFCFEVGKTIFSIFS